MEDLTTVEALYRFGVALAIGALVGIERETSARREQLKADASAADGEGGGKPPIEALRAAISAGEASAIAYADATPSEQSGRLQVPPIPPPTAQTSATRGLEDRSEGAAGIRTFSLVAISGALAGYLAALTDSPWVFVAAMICMAALNTVGYLGMMRRGDIGLTSEVTWISVFLLGGLCAYGDTVLAGAVAVVVTLILSIKESIQSLARRIKREDIHAVVKFAILTLVILPLFPEEPLNIGEQFYKGDLEEADELPWWVSLSVHPRKIWYMVILISAISFSGYVLGQLLGTGRGLMVTAIVGGLASSTAVSLSYSQRSLERPELSPQFAIGILLANSIMPIRLLVVVVIIAPSLLQYLVVPLLLMVAAGGLFSLVLHTRQQRTEETAEVQLKNPFEIGPALKFGLLFGVVLFGAQIAQALWSDTGLYVVAVLTGLTDVDAIGLAVANLVSDGDQNVVTGAITITLAVISNTVVKAYFVATMGTKRLRRIALGAFGLMFLAALGGIVVLWALAV